jgi:hypothetical protein
MKKIISHYADTIWVYLSSTFQRTLANDLLARNYPSDEANHDLNVQYGNFICCLRSFRFFSTGIKNYLWGCFYLRNQRS